MPPKKIKVNTYQELERKVLECLRDKLVWDIFVEAWRGIGAGAVLRRAAEAVDKKELIEFDTAFELEGFAVYGSRREAQRAVAEHLSLEPSIMAKFDEADEDDDFSGVPASSRGMIPEVAGKIRRAVKERRMLLLLRNNFTDEWTVIDFNDLEIPIARWGPNKLLWTFGRGFSEIKQLLDWELMRAVAERTNVIVSVRENINAAVALDFVYAEAVEIGRYIFESSGGRLQATPSTVLRCLWYSCLLVLHTGPTDDQPRQRFVNYLVCESILQGGEDDAACWEFGKAVARMVLPEAGGHVLELWKEIITSREMSLSIEWRPPKPLIIDRFTDKHRGRILASQEEESYGCMAVKVSPDDPELDNFLDDCRRDLERGTSVLRSVSSIFWKFETTCQALPDSFFECFGNVRVLDLFGCIVSPIDSSLALLHNLRMLKMEKCRVSGEQSSVNASPLLSAQQGQGGPNILFHSLWVLILYNSDADKFLIAGKAFGHMPNLQKLDLEDETFAFPHLGAQKGLGSLRKLRMNCPVQLEGTDDKGLFQQMHKLQVFDLSENSHIKFLPKFLSMAINLKKLVLNRCTRLESLNLNHLPATIETVSLQFCTSLQEVVELADPASLPNLKTFRLSESELITKLCLQGCRKLKNVDLQELWKLKVLNLSCTAVKALEFLSSKVEKKAFTLYDEERWTDHLPQLKQLYLLGCEQLHRVALQKEQEPPRLDVLYLDNYSNTCSADRCFDSFQNQTEHYAKGISDADGRGFFQAHVVVRDFRLFRSLNSAFSDHLDRTKARIHIHVKCSSTTKRGDITDTATKPGAGITSITKSSPLIVSNLSTPRYADVLGAVKDHRRLYRPPSPPAMPLNNHIEVHGGDRRSLIEEESFRKWMRFAESLFVHENTSALPVNVSMSSLKCFRIENCPNMEFVFAWDEGGGNVLVELESMWLSHLPRLNAISKGGRIVPESYSQLKHIYLEFCSRVKYVLFLLSVPHNLETIDIRYCGELRAIFIDNDDGEDKRGANPKLFLKLRSIHLEELPKLQHVYKPNICAPSLQDLTIRGCSRLRKLPLFYQSDSQSRRDVKISCEKDWWDNLERDEPEASYGSSHFKPKHCPSYKKPMRARWL